MNIKLYPPLYLNEKGKRDNNEDSIFPLPQMVSENDTLFVVCDGVGGIDKGEVASHLACESFAEYFEQNHITISSEQEILSAFAYVQQQFDEYILKEPSAKGFGTTLVLLHTHQNGLTVAHCGDSRFYQIRENKIIFKTVDHTPVNDLVKNGIITPEEAALYPKSSRISRAIQGNIVQRTKPDVQLISDLKVNDYLVLCSDGIYGCMSDNDFVDILTANNLETEKLETIKTLCNANSNDNFSLYLLKIKEILS
jgi:protein phosphatase